MYINYCQASQSAPRFLIKLNTQNRKLEILVCCDSSHVVMTISNFLIRLFFSWVNDNYFLISISHSYNHRKYWLLAITILNAIIYFKLPNLCTCNEFQKLLDWGRLEVCTNLKSVLKNNLISVSDKECLAGQVQYFI